jgi:hypothetical protein
MSCGTATSPEHFRCGAIWSIMPPRVGVAAHRHVGSWGRMDLRGQLHVQNETAGFPLPFTFEAPRSLLFAPCLRRSSDAR